MKNSLKQLLIAHYPALLLFLVFIAVAYWRLPMTFYQQDEWQTLGNNLVQGWRNLFIDVRDAPLNLFFSEGRVLLRALNLIFFGVFTYTVAPIAIFAMIFHFINTVLVYFLTIKLSESRIAGLVAGLFFAVNAVGHEAVTWSAAVGTVAATTFILLAILAYYRYLESPERRWLLWTGLFTIISFSFKEIGIFLVILFPILYYLHRRPTIVSLVKANSLLLIYGVIAIAIRLSTFINAGDKAIGAIATGGEGFAGKLIFRLILYPLTGLFQPLIPADTMYVWAETIGYQQYPYLRTSPLADIVPQTIVTDLLSLLGLTFVALAVVTVYYLRKQKDSAFLLFVLTFTVLSYLPYAVIDRGGSYMDSRYYYLGVIGTGMLLGYLLSYLWQRHLVTRIAALAVLLAVVTMQYMAFSTILTARVDVANERRTILETIKSAQPQLNDQAVFYVTGNRDHYIPGNKVPFQQGIGYTLLVWYYKTKSIPAAFLDDNYLWDQGSQGYRVIDGQGFGFFSELPALQQAVRENQIRPENVYAFSWDSDTEVLSSINDSIRAQLQ